MAGIKIDPEMLDIYMELLNKLMAGSETDGGNARLEVSGAGKTEDGLVRYNEEVNKLGDDLRELYGNEGEILGRIRDGTLFKNADKVSVVARSTDDAGVLAKHADEAAAWLHGGKVFRYSDETAEAVASGEKLLKESGTIYESFADMMSPEDAKRYLDFLENGSREGLTSAELADALLVSQKVGYEDVWDLRNAGDVLETSYGKSREIIQCNTKDAAADELAKRIGGQSRSAFADDPIQREFDVISDQYIAQAKPPLKCVNKTVRTQMKATFEAAKKYERKVYYQFEGIPSQEVLDKLYEYSERYGVEVIIDTEPLGILN